MPAARPPTLVEVARLAGVSLTTASKAINDKGRISPETRARVMTAAAKLHYTPNQYARSLITGRTSTVGLIMYDSLTARFAVPIMLGAESAFTEIDLSLITADAGGDTGRFRDLVGVFARRQADGVLVIGDNNHMTPSVTALAPMPVVYAYGRSENADDPVHLVDDEHGGYLLARHLVDTGRTRIAHVTGPRGTTAVDQRLAGIRRALRESGTALVGGVRHGPWSQRSGRSAAAKLIAAHPDVDAVLCGSDQIAAGVVDALQATGRRVPEDVAVSGYDNWEPFALETDPPLTTVELDLHELGQAAARDLFTLIDGTGHQPGEHRYRPRLIVRRSTGRR